MPETQRPEPEATRPHMPGYGLEGAKSAPGQRLPWSGVDELLASSRCYWVCTTRPDGRPHAAPVWGIWLEDTFYFSTGRRSRKARNLTANREIVVHLESGEKTVILEGGAEEVSDPALFARIADVYETKYDWRLTAEECLASERGKAPSMVYAVQPRVAFSFQEELIETATRWRFRDG